ncbi:hypothetical protein LCGC14_2915440, partial [marine sediment metagenome]
MKIISKFDKALLVLGFLIVISLFTLTFVIYFRGGSCVIDPIKYAIEHNIS